MIRTIIVDDEQHARSTLSGLLKQVDIPLEIIGEAGTLATAKQLVEQTNPDLIFLDVQLKEGTGFNLLEKLPDLKSEVIFVTAYDKYAIQAFQMAAFGYLLKPLQISELDEVLERFQSRFGKVSTAERSRILINNHGADHQKKIVLSNMNGFRVVELSQVIYLRGEVNYTRFFLTTGEQILVSKTLRDYELLDEMGFFRIHQSSMINLSHLVEYRRGEGGAVIMTNQDELAVSRRRKQEFIERFFS
ncbi:MAG: LytR/AlgR family response regulator transcription factor [Saprospiraceae bacterium]